MVWGGVCVKQGTELRKEEARVYAANAPGVDREPFAGLLRWQLAGAPCE